MTADLIDAIAMAIVDARKRLVKPGARPDLAREYARAALAALDAAGLVVVPREPTPAMIEAAVSAVGVARGYAVHRKARVAWPAMLSAAPTAKPAAPAPKP